MARLITGCYMLQCEDRVHAVSASPPPLPPLSRDLHLSSPPPPQPHPGGELLDRIIHKGTYSERDAADAFRVMIKAVDLCHANNVVHRDIKPDNFLLRER